MRAAMAGPELRFSLVDMGFSLMLQGLLDMELQFLFRGLQLVHCVIRRQIGVVEIVAMVRARRATFAHHHDAIAGGK
jgi:hypothetical protein